MTVLDQTAFEALEFRLKTLLPAEYQDCYEDVQPVSMGAAGLRYGSDGKVAWGEIWESFCDLAMAGGPPHKGTLLEPGAKAEIDAAPGRYREVVAEIRRGVGIVTGLRAKASSVPGWVRVDCSNSAMAEWLVRAIVMENVSSRCKGAVLELPAGPGFRLEKEIKNVITALAKTSHYWADHLFTGQQRVITKLFTDMSRDLPPVTPALAGYDFRMEKHEMLCRKMAEALRQATGLSPSNHQYSGWLGVDCPDVQFAVWMMRGLVASNVLSRREGTALFVPVNPVIDPEGLIVVRRTAQICSFAAGRAYRVAGR